MTTPVNDEVGDERAMVLAAGQSTADLFEKDDDTLISEARFHREQAEHHQQRAYFHCVELGRRLIVLQQRLARRGRGNNEFATAVGDEVGVSRAYAYNLIELAREENVGRVRQIMEDEGLSEISVHHALEALHQQRREARRQAARDAYAARHQFPPPTFELPEHLHMEVGDCGDLPMGDDMIDLIVTSPPYGLGMDYSETDDDEGYETYRDRIDQWAAEMYRVTGHAGRLCLNVPLDVRFRHPKPLYADWVSGLLDAGWLYRETIIWNEGNISRSTARGSVDSPNSPATIARVEMIAVVYKTVWNLERQGEPADITHDEWLEWTNGLWTFPGARPISENHCPAPFPEELPRRCMRLYSFPGDVILDPFMGSGTTGIAAAQTNRQFYGFDHSAMYVEQSRERLGDALASLGYDGYVAGAHTGNRNDGRLPRAPHVVRG